MMSIGVMLTFIFFFAFINGSLLFKFDRNGKALAIYILLFLVRLSLLFYQSTHGDLPMSGGDWPVFHANGTGLISQADSFWELLSPSSAEWQRTDLYDRIVAVVYYLFGECTAYMYFFSYMMSELTFLFIFKTAKLIAGGKVAAWSALIFYFWPMEIIFSVAYLREMTIQCSFAVSLFFFVKYLVNRNLGSLFMAFLFVYWCARMHSGMIAAFFAYIAVFAFYNPYKRTLTITPVKMAAVSLLMLGALGAGVFTSATSRFSGVEDSSDIIRKTGSVQGNTDYISAPGSPAGILLQTPLRFFYFVTSPLPWQVRGVGTLIAFLLDGTARIYVIYQIIRILRNRRRLSPANETLVRVFLVIWIASNLIFSWGTNNYGSAMRHRLKTFPIEIMLIYTIAQQAKRRLQPS